MPTDAPNDAMRVVAALLVDHHGRLFAAQRPASARQGGLWELPGGKVEPGESDAQALRRELDEELGIAVDCGAHVATSVHAYPHATIALIGYACSSAEAPTLREHSASRWLTADDAWSVEWAPADVAIVRAWVAQAS